MKAYFQRPASRLYLALSFTLACPVSVLAAPVSAALLIEQPTAERFTADVPLRLKVADDVATDTLKIRLNGRRVDADAFTEHLSHSRCNLEPGYQAPYSNLPIGPGACQSSGSTVEGVLGVDDGLQSGQNTLMVSAFNADGTVDAESVDFNYTPATSGLGATDSTRYMPKSVGLTVAGGGVLPWVNITTGWPQPATDDPDAHALPYYDASFPLSTDTACTSTDVYQVVVLDRKTPANEIAYRCFSTDADLTTYLGTLTADEIVIAGTTANQVAGRSLDTTKIGGSDYALSADVSTLPLGYAVIGVGGATPGTAYENYYTPSDPVAWSDFVGATPVEMVPHADGTLNYDVNGNYSFVSGESQSFVVTPGDSASVQIGGITYYSPSQWEGLTNGFFLLVMDRQGLAPANSSDPVGAPFCRTNMPLPGSCGVFYPTGDTNLGPAALQNLTDALNGVTPRQIAILTTVGTPLVSSADIDVPLAVAISKLGGTYYTMQNLAFPGSNFTLVANGADTQAMLLSGNRTSTFAKGVAESTNVFAQQNQSGVLRGLFARDDQGLYYAMQVAQQSMTGWDAAAPVDYSFHLLTTAPNVDWPMADTAGHIAAYHYISNQYLSQYPMQMQGAYAYDLRYHYPSLSDAVEQGSAWFAGSCPDEESDDFTPTEYCDVWGQLKSEIAALHSVRSLFGSSGLRQIFTNNIAPDVIAASYTIHEGQFTVTPTGDVNMNVANWLKLGSGIASLIGQFSGPAGPLFSITSAILNIGSTASAMKAKPTDPVQFESQYDVSLGQTDAYAAAFTANIPIAYDTSLNMVYSDWTKLQTVGAKIDDTSSGWQLSDSVSGDALSNAIQTGAQRALYVQVVPSYYEIDYHFLQPVTAIGLLGSINDTNEACDAIYSGIPDDGYGESIDVGTNGTQADGRPAMDFLVLAGNLSGDRSASMKESMPSQALLDTLFTDPNGATTGYLNLPKDLIFSNSSLFTYRQGAMYSTTYCYKVPCQFDLHNGPGSCVGP